MKLNQSISQKWSRGGRQRELEAERERAQKREELRNRTILVDPDKCTGCDSCVTVCSGRRDENGDRKFSSIRVIRPGGTGQSIPVLCTQCKNALCLSVCPGAVLSREREYDILTVDEQRCTSCGSCLFSCAFDVLHLGGRRLAAEPCDLCGGAPACVKACGAGALQFVDIDDEVIAAKHRTTERLAALDG
jgi:anaerobic carbon-monoxide dehydrogenase iron sulfur subunit